MVDAAFRPKDRYAAGEAWDELGGLPDDQDAWVLCHKCADGGGDLLAAKYPVTNVQFDRFIQADGYDNPVYWGGRDSLGWRWRWEEHPSYRGEGPVTQPEYWQNPRFGKDRRGYPVVGVTWYEAAAYAAWLMEHLQTVNRNLQVWRNGQLEGRKLKTGTIVRLPTEDEWLRLAGGAKAGQKERYPWDVLGSGHITDSESDAGQQMILARANTAESGLDGTSPVAMYPLGESRPFGLWDVAGNVWEWAESRYDKAQRAQCGAGRVVARQSKVYLPVGALREQSRALGH